MGQIPRRANIVNITTSFPCVVTTEFPHEYKTFNFVRLTDLNGAMPIPRGEDPLNNNRYKISVTGDTTFTIHDPITFHVVDSTLYPPYVTGGFCNLIESEFIYHNDGDNNG